MLLDRAEAGMRPSFRVGTIPPFPACEDRAVPMVWTRFCPLCSRRLQKADPQAPWVCPCGWRGGG